MHDLTALGPAAVDDAALAVLVAGLLGHDEVSVVSCLVEPVAYDVPSITTVGRHWVSGLARTPSGDEPWRMFVKHVQAWHHSPFFAFVPDEMKPFARDGVPWRTEPAVYRSDLASRLPDGLSMPSAVGVVDLEPDAAAIWLPEVGGPPAAWTGGRYERAAHLLGRLAANAEVAPLAGAGGFEWDVFHYVHGRLAASVLPVVLGAEAWEQPVVAAAFGPELRDRMRDGAARISDLAGELAALPRTTSHGDASPHNLLPGATSDELVMIDFNFWMPKAVGFDLGQLIAGDTQLGGGPSDLAAVDAACVASYVDGLRAEGLDVDEALVRRAHAVQLFVYAGVSALPEDPAMSAEVVSRRAELARHSLDLLDATS